MNSICILKCILNIQPYILPRRFVGSNAKTQTFRVITQQLQESDQDLILSELLTPNCKTGIQIKTDCLCIQNLCIYVLVTYHLSLLIYIISMYTCSIWHIVEALNKCSQVTQGQVIWKGSRVIEWQNRFIVIEVLQYQIFQQENSLKLFCCSIIPSPLFLQ